MVAFRADEGDLFPRNAPTSTPRIKKRNGEVLFGPENKKSRESRQNEPPAAQKAPVLREGANLTLSRLSVGITVLGLITKADQTSVELSLASGLFAKAVDDSLIQDTSTVPTGFQTSGQPHDKDDPESSSDGEESRDNDEGVHSSVRPLWQVVDVGQVFPVSVVEVPKQDNQARKVVQVSLKPDLVNVGLNSAHLLTSGFPAYAAIQSVEDHGYILSFGNNISHSGFLPFEMCDHQPGGDILQPGTPLHVVTISSTRTKQAKRTSVPIRVSARRLDAIRAKVEALNNPSFQDLRAGMLLRAKVLATDSGGASLLALGVFPVVVDSTHIPQTKDKSAIVESGKNVLVRILHVDPAGKIVTGSVLPNLVHDLKPRMLPSQWKTGCLLKELEVVAVKPKYALVLRSTQSSHDGSVYQCVEPIENDTDVSLEGDQKADDQGMRSVADAKIAPVVSESSKIDINEKSDQSRGVGMEDDTVSGGGEDSVAVERELGRKAKSGANSEAAVGKSAGQQARRCGADLNAGLGEEAMDVAEIPLVAHVSRVSDTPLSLESAFRKTQRIPDGGRIIAVSRLDGVVKIDLRPSVLSRKAMTIDEVESGEVYHCKIISHNSYGDIIVGVDKDTYLTGKIHHTHISDVPHRSDRLSNLPNYKIGATLPCRVLSVDIQRGKIFLSARKSLLKPKFPLLTSLQSAADALKSARGGKEHSAQAIYSGTVLTCTEKGNLLIEFCNRIVGLARWSELCMKGGKEKQPSNEEIEAIYPRGQTVSVRLLSVDPKQERMALSMDLRMQFAHRTLGVLDKATRCGQFVEASVVGVDTELKQFVVQAKLVRDCSTQGADDNTGSVERGSDQPDSPSFECRLPFGHLSDVDAMSEVLAGRILRHLKKIGKRKQSPVVIPKAVVLRIDDDGAVLSAKPSIRRAVSSGAIPSALGDLASAPVEKNFLRGYVKALSTAGVIVGFMGDLVGFAHKSMVADRFVSDVSRVLSIDQSVCAMVQGVDEQAGRLSLSLRSSDVGAAHLQEDTQAFFNELSTWTAILGESRTQEQNHIGVITTARVKAAHEHGIEYNVKLGEQKSVGVLLNMNSGAPPNAVIAPSASSSENKPEAEKEELPDSRPGSEHLVRVIDTDPFTGVFDLSNRPEVLEKKQPASVAPLQNFSATVLLVKSGYVILALRVSKKRYAIAFALGPMVSENLLIRPGVQVQCTSAAKVIAHRNLAVIDWKTFRSRGGAGRISSQDSDYAESLIKLRKNAVQDESAVTGICVSGNVSATFPMYVFVGIAKGIVGRLHASNCGTLAPAELDNLPLGMLPEKHVSSFALPKIGERLSPLFVVGLRGTAPQNDTETIAFELARTKALCQKRHFQEGQRVFGVLAGLSTRFHGVSARPDEAESQAPYLVSLSPSIFVLCPDVDCLTEAPESSFKLGVPVSCMLSSVDERANQFRGCLSNNGSADGYFSAIVTSIIEGTGIFVTVPWLISRRDRDHLRKGLVCVTEVCDDFDEVAGVLNDLKPGDVIRMRKTDTDSIGDEPRKYISLCMRADSDSPRDITLNSVLLRKLKNGSRVRGFVRSVGSKGCFVTIGCGLVAQVKLRDLSDEFVSKPKKDFPVGKVVEGSVVVATGEKGKLRVSMMLRKRPRASLNSDFASGLNEGTLVMGTVKRVIDSGAIVEISPGTTALLGKKEADQDRFIVAAMEEWVVGQKLNAVVIKCHNNKVYLGTMRCYFEAAGLDEHKVDELLEQNEKLKAAAVNGDVALGEQTGKIKFADKEDELNGKLTGETVLESVAEEDDSDTPKRESMGSESEDDDDDIVDEATLDIVAIDAKRKYSVPSLQVSHKFHFEDAAAAGEISNTNQLGSIEEDTGDEQEEGKGRKTSREKREKKRVKQEAETAIRLREEALARDPDSAETSSDFERLLVGNPNSSTLWIQYMSFCLNMSQVDKARAIAERALETIALEAELDRVNVWMAYINLEAEYGAMNSVVQAEMEAPQPKGEAAIFRVFERACDRITDVQGFHIRVAKTVRQTHRNLSDEILRRANRRYKTSKEVWMALGESQFESGDLTTARRTLERALLSLENREHVAIISKFAWFEYKHGSSERGRTVFESLIGNFPKRVDLWNVYLDLEIACCGDSSDSPESSNEMNQQVGRTRVLFERFTSCDLSSKKMKSAFKKWLDFEKSFGSKEQEKVVKTKAREYVERKSALE